MSDTFEYAVTGKKDGPTVVLVHGWPDSPAVFEAQVEALRDTYRIVLFTLPGYGGAAVNGMPFFGYTFRQLIDMYAATIEAVMTGRPASDKKPTIIAHDWGAILSYELLTVYPDIAKQFVALDIGGHIDKAVLPVKAKLIIVAYQWTNIICYLLPHFFTRPVIRTMVTYFKAPNPAQSHPRMGYPYLQLWKGLLTGRGALVHSKSFFKTPVPMLYLYGTKKPFHFHSKRFVESMGENQKGFPGGHWFFRQSATKDDVNKCIIAFLDKNARL
jgi:cis-3-alkyl-4-acyloxetan-2-one decarboxylase